MSDVCWHLSCALFTLPKCLLPDVIGQYASDLPRYLQRLFDCRHLLLDETAVKRCIFIFALDARRIRALLEKLYGASMYWWIAVGYPVNTNTRSFCMRSLSAAIVLVAGPVLVKLTSSKALQLNPALGYLKYLIYIHTSDININGKYSIK